MKKLFFVLLVCVIVVVLGCSTLKPEIDRIFNNPNTHLRVEVKWPVVHAQSITPIPTGAASDYITLARQDAREAGIDPQLFVNQMQTESHLNPNAQGGHGEIGIAQFMPETARGLGIDPHDPVASLKGAAQLMARYVTKYGDYAKALAVYNAGPSALQFAITQGGSNWKAFLPLSTQQYITTIMS